MKELIEDMGVGQFLGGLLVMCLLAFGMYDCSAGRNKTFPCEIVDREIRTHYDKDHHLQTDYYVYALAEDGVHCVDVTRRQFFSLQIGEKRSLSARYGKVSHVIYFEVIR